MEPSELEKALEGVNKGDPIEIFNKETYGRLFYFRKLLIKPERTEPYILVHRNTLDIEREAGEEGYDHHVIYHHDITGINRLQRVNSD